MQGEKFEKQALEGMKTRRNKKTNQIEIYWDKSEASEEAQ